MFENANTNFQVRYMLEFYDHIDSESLIEFFDATKPFGCINRGDLVWIPALPRLSDRLKVVRVVHGFWRHPECRQLTHKTMIYTKPCNLDGGKLNKGDENG